MAELDNWLVDNPKRPRVRVTAGWVVALVSVVTVLVTVAYSYAYVTYEQEAQAKRIELVEHEAGNSISRSEFDAAMARFESRFDRLDNKLDRAFAERR